MTNSQIVRRLESALGSIHTAILDLNQLDGYESCKTELMYIADELGTALNTIEELMSLRLL